VAGAETLYGMQRIGVRLTPVNLAAEIDIELAGIKTYPTIPQFQRYNYLLIRKGFEFESVRWKNRWFISPLFGSFISLFHFN
jgi:hypothetical protein